MGWISAAIGAGAGLFGSVAQRGIESVFGIDRNKEQLEQQQKLTEMQEGSNRRLMNESFALQKEMYDHSYDKNKPLQQMKNLQEAGLNPALMYGLGGQGGTTGGAGTSNVGGGQAANAAEMRQAEEGMAMQKARLISELKVNDSIAEKNKADAEQAREAATTESGQRNILIEKMRQEGISSWLENVRTNFLNEYDPREDGENEMELSRNAELNISTAIQKSGGFSREAAMTIAKTEAEAGNELMQKILTEEKAVNYWRELLNETIKANAAASHAEAAHKQAANDAVKAAAIKLSTEWDVGEFTNWKTWADQAKGALNVITNAVK